MITFTRVTGVALSLMFAFNAPLVALAETLKLSEGAVVRLKLRETISSADAYEGQAVKFEVVGDVVAPGTHTVLIKAGTAASGSISHVEERGAIGKEGELGLSLDRTTAVDGSRVPLRAQLKDEGKSKRGSTIALGVVTGLIFLPGFLFLMKKGKDAKLPAGAEMDAYVNMDMLVNADSGGATAQTAAEQTNATLNTMMEAEAGAGDDAYLEELETLGRLYQKGILTEAEFNAKKKQLLGL